MPKYSVIVTRDTTESVVVEVESDTPENAELAALEQIWNAEEPPDWEPDDPPCSGDAYTNGADLIA